MAFNYVGSVNGTGRKLKKLQCTASEAIAVGDAVFLTGTTGAAVVATSSSQIEGIVVGFCDKYGVPITDTTVTAGTAAEFNKTSDSSTATSDYILVDVNPGSLYSCELDATIATTTGSNKAGVWFVLVDKNTLDESSVVSTYDTTSTLVHAYSRGVDPRNSARVICTFKLANQANFV